MTIKMSRQQMMKEKELQLILKKSQHESAEMQDAIIRLIASDTRRSVTRLEFYLVSAIIMTSILI
jgi:chromosomal replication initiation ATPase DnaA